LVRRIIACGILIAAPICYAAKLPSPAILVVIKGENALDIVDPGTRKVVGRIPVGQDPHEVAISPDWKLAFVTNHGPRETNPGSTISVIDIASQKEIRRVDVGARSRPHGLWFAAGKLYFTAEGNKLIGCYDPVRDHIDWRLGTGQNRTHLVILSQDTNHIFAANTESNTISAFDRAPEPLDWEQTVIQVGKRPQGIDMSPDGKEVWTANIADGTVSIIDAATKKVKETLPLGLTHPIRLKFTLDGKRVIICDDAGNAVVMVDAVTRREMKRMSPGRSPEGMMIAPDGVHAYVAVTKDNNIAVIDVNTLELVGRIQTGQTPDSMAWVK